MGVGRDDVFVITEVNMDTGVNGKLVFTSPGSKTMACWTLRVCGNPGDPMSLSKRRVCRTTEEGGRQMRHRESDSFVVPVKAGNAAGGKETTHGSAV